MRRVGTVLGDIGAKPLLLLRGGFTSEGELAAIGSESESSEVLAFLELRRLARSGFELDISPKS